MITKHPLFNKNLTLLILCQGLFLTNNVTFIAINGLVGLSLSPVAWMATLPVMGYVVGGAFSTSIVAKTQNYFGRKISFQLGLLVAVFSALLCAYAAISRNFWLLVLGTFIAGYYSANGQLYRFAAAELTVASQRDKAVSWVLAGGILGAVIGPNLASWTQNLFETAFLGAYLSLSIAGLIGIFVMQFIHFPEEFKTQHSLSAGRDLKTILSQPVFMVAVIGASLGYGVMNLLMAATPAGYANLRSTILRYRNGIGVACDWYVRARIFYGLINSALWHTQHHGCRGPPQPLVYCNRPHGCRLSSVSHCALFIGCRLELFIHWIHLISNDCLPAGRA